MLMDTPQVIRLDPSSPSGYERKYTTLLGAGHVDGASDAVRMMPSKMLQSRDTEIHGKYDHNMLMYVYSSFPVE